jgi:hypothetical protein
VEVEDGLTRPRANVDGESVVVEPCPLGGLGHELEHALHLVGRKLGDLLEAGDVPLGEDEQVDVRLRVDVADGDEAIPGMDVVSVGVQLAEEAVVRQRGSPPR